MFFKEDWDKAKERFDAFWEGEIIDRCCISVIAPRKKPLDSKIEFAEARDLVQKWLDSELRMEQELFWFSRNFYGGEAFPYTWNNLGPGVLASFISSKYTLANETVWFDREPVIHDWNNMPDIKLDENSKMWQVVTHMTDSFARKADGRYFVGMTDLGGNFDIAASLRGSERLLLDLFDFPDEVKELIKRIDEVWFEAYDRLYEIISRYMQGTSAWMPVWCRERWYPLQCDFSTMISPSMFEEFVIPSLAREAEFLDRAIYHLDGPEEIQHLDYILDIPGIDGIQWVPIGKFDEDTGVYYLDQADDQWFPMYEKIQAKGKRLVLMQMRAKDVEKLVRNLSSKGLFIYTTCTSEDEARQLISNVQKWTRD